MLEKVTLRVLVASPEYVPWSVCTARGWCSSMRVKGALLPPSNGARMRMRAAPASSAMYEVPFTRIHPVELLGDVGVRAEAGQETHAQEHRGAERHPSHGRSTPRSTPIRRVTPMRRSLLRSGS